MILITGCARSGTSLTTQILQSHGLHLGPVNVLFENTDIRESVLKPYLRAIGTDPRGQKPLPDTDSLPAHVGLRDAVLKRVPETSGYKDAKLTLVWPVWAKAFPQAKWVLVRRKAEDIAGSCLRASFMNAFDTMDGWLGWVAEHEKRFEKMKAALDIIEVWPRDYIEDAGKFQPVADHCGLAFNGDAVKAAIHPGLFLSA